MNKSSYQGIGLLIEFDFILIVRLVEELLSRIVVCRFMELSNQGLFKFVASFGLEIEPPAFKLPGAVNHKVVEGHYRFEGGSFPLHDC